MPNTISIDATKARSSFFTILDKVFKNKSLVYEIKKSGIPVATITKYPPPRTKNIMKFAGSWASSGKNDDVFAEKLVKSIYSDRKSSKKTKRKLPKI